MARQSFAEWRLPSQLEGILVREDRAAEGPRFTLTERHAHDELELHFIERGGCSTVFHDRRIELSAGSLIWIPPGRVHILLNGSRDLIRWVLLMRRRAVRRVLPSAALSARLAISAVEAVAVLGPRDAATLRRVYEEVHLQFRWRASDPGAIKAVPLTNAGVAYALARSFQLLQSASPSADPGAFHTLVARALLLLRETVPPPTLRELAQKVHASEAHLSKLFSAQVGTSVTEFRNRIRLERFLRLYGDGTRLKMTAAALDAGFGSYPQFHRVFRAQMGRSPADYAAELRA